MKTRTFKDKVIAYKKADKYLAVSLEFDLLAEGENIMQALERLYDATSGYLYMCCEDKEKDEEIYRKAPKKYHDLYNLFVELSEKDVKKENEKKQEKVLMAKEVSSAQWTYNSKNLCHA